MARVVDVERATGIFDSVDDLSLAVSAFRGPPPAGRHHDPRCKDAFFALFDSGYRDLQFNVELNGFVGELQLNLRRILQVKAKAHKVTKSNASSRPKRTGRRCNAPSRARGSRASRSCA